MECLRHLESRGDSRPRLFGRPQADFGVGRMRDNKAFAEQIIRTLREAGHQAYLVGGCVRDLLLGASLPTTTSPPTPRPNEVMQHFSQDLRRGRAVRRGAGAVREIDARPHG